MTTSGTSIVHRELPATRTEQIIDPPALLADTAELRDRTTQTSSQAKELHHDVEQLNLDQLTRALEATSPVALLDELADDFVFPWSLLARVVGVSPTAVRKWRRGETVTAAHHHRLAEFVAFCRTLRWRDPRILDVPHWLEMPVDARSDVTRLDMFLDGVRLELLDLAAGRRSGAGLLDERVAGWRERTARAGQFEVIVHEDGTTSIVPRAEAAPREG